MLIVNWLFAPIRELAAAIRELTAELKKQRSEEVAALVDTLRKPTEDVDAGLKSNT